MSLDSEEDMTRGEGRKLGMEERSSGSREDDEAILEGKEKGDGIG